jgi:hypothetical protein
MGRKASAALIRIGIAAALAISLASCGGSSSSAPGSTTSGGAGSTTTGGAGSGTTGGAGSTTAGQAPAHGIAVTPPTGHPTTTFSLRFTAPPSTRSEPNSRIGFAVALTAPAGSGCIGARSLGAPGAPQGEPVTVTLDPARLGGRWCPGVHSVRVIETESPVCKAGTMCPQFVRVVRTVGATTFRVTS